MAKKVHRDEKSNGLGLGLTLGFFALLGAQAAGVTDGLVFWTIVGAAAAVGFTVGRIVKTRRCSGCRERLSVAHETCPGCQATIIGPS